MDGELFTIFLLSTLIQNAEAFTFVRDNFKQRLESSSQQPHDDRIIPGYIYDIHERHRESFHEMPRFSRNSVSLNGHLRRPSDVQGRHNMGLVTSIIHHKLHSTQSNLRKKTLGYYYENSLREQMVSGISFLLANGFHETNKKADLVDIQLRLRYQNTPLDGSCQRNTTNDTLKNWITISMENTREEYHEVFFEPDRVEQNCTHNSGWITIPLNRMLTERLLNASSSRRRRRKVEFNLRSPLMTDPSHTMSPDLGPHLLSFHRDHSIKDSLSRRRRSTSSSVQFTKPRKMRNLNRRERFTTSTGTNQIVHLCQRRDLMVNFKSVGWSNWIISPAGYNAGFCWGHCPFPLSSFYNSSNHATILYMIHSMNIAKIQAPCCVAHEMGDESILHFTNNGDLVMQVYEDMSVKSCSCR